MASGSAAPPSSSGVDPDTPRKEDLELLAMLEAQNRLIEQDAKAKASIRPPCAPKGHSRQHSTASAGMGSLGSGTTGTTAAGPPNRSSGSSPVEHLQDEHFVQWGQIVSDWDMYVKRKNHILKEMVRQGIPAAYRPIVWQLMCQTYISPVRELYYGYLSQASPFEKLIGRDIARTYPNHEYFKETNGIGQEGLFNVMKAYSLHDREVGYCQGSAFIVGLLLTIMSEEETFCILVKLMTDYRLRELFKPNMTELGLCMYQLECLIQEMIPDLYIHFQSQSFHTSTYASSWFLTLFSTNLPMEQACRVMDVFISEGMDAIFRIAIAILQHFRAHLLQQDMEGMLKCLQKDLPVLFETNPHGIMNASYVVKLNVKKMKKLEKEYMALKSREQEDMVELRRLRTENNLLRQRVGNLEQETSELADRLVKEQIERQHENDEAGRVRREMERMRRDKEELEAKLARANHAVKAMQDQMCGTAGTPGFNMYQKDAEISKLQKELRAVRVREVDWQKTMRELKERVQELEESNRRMRDARPEHGVARMQEELTAVRMREAEANLSMRELRKRVADLETEWQRHLARHHTPNGPTQSGSLSKSAASSSVAALSSLSVQQLQEELMTVRLREAESLADAKEIRQKLMQVESHNSFLHNQLRRAEDDQRSVKKAHEQLEEAVHALEDRLKEELNKREDLEAELRTCTAISELCEADKNQTIAVLEARLAELEIRNEELRTLEALRETEKNVRRYRESLSVSSSEGDAAPLETAGTEVRSAPNASQ
ncbi:EVI5-like protein [Paramacrobiotus metropolitanus]|uniref:EVI5-like protein n=1 Tax=Paramacrobiotus metropolitanus TaxID=2943436 RepID=UPI0024465416|nr:EVI5-like protein [Paramacrobiotus metropolitanus]XP_055329660.1 EVI5-like protein [Paramacrobiotus metropolitanus]XP_055329661.1 EVI5-like protein [Paramacrobiotus metropolitanus]XP_055329662.1 EVI5-like protein [Paramacrobiotus metropolitanus]XP_055329663.1 EVI5-like protein [Paramacrobiotus metropolitanus]XP_055329665.1 EVI5-like protein [Paramacrobiotus metropolitanus]XP_055329666.1 EVI5-like protein [Paramacrobiotus metropolitanus]